MIKLKLVGLSLLLLTLPNCIFKRSSRKYDCARAAYENILYKYEREMDLFEGMQKAGTREEKLRLEHEFKDEILLKNEEYNKEHSGFFSRKNEIANYPFTQYKQALDCSVDLLENSKAQLYWKQEGLGKSFQDLVNTLDQMRKYIVLSKEYSDERRMIERRKIMDVEKKDDKKIANASTKASSNKNTQVRRVTRRKQVNN